MKKIYLLSLCLFFSSSLLLSQQVPVSDLKKSVHAAQLKNGILLVLLPNSDKKIETLRNQGKEKLANIEEEEVNLTRSELVEAFDKEYTFGRFYFIEAETLKEILAGEFTNVLDSNLDKVQQFPAGQNLYLARYGPGNPNGEHYKYNGIGLQIRYINNNQVETIKYDMFYAAYRKFRISNFFKKKRRGKLDLVEEINTRLHNVKIKS